MSEHEYKQPDSDNDSLFDNPDLDDEAEDTYIEAITDDGN